MCTMDCSGAARLVNDSLGVVIDVCGVCGGNGTSCIDCLGVPNGTAAFDQCGVCNTNQSDDCVQDCHGVWGGNLSLDMCSVCGGANIACADCAGEPNGPATTDRCGWCDAVPHNDCVQVCHVKSVFC